MRLAREYGVRTCTVSEEQIGEAMLDLWNRRDLLRGPVGGGLAIASEKSAGTTVTISLALADIEPG